MQDEGSADRFRFMKVLALHPQSVPRARPVRPRCRRYGRPVRLGEDPTRPRTQVNTAGEDARRLCEHLHRRHPSLLAGPQVRVLWQVLAQNHHRGPSGRLR